MYTTCSSAQKAAPSRIQKRRSIMQNTGFFAHRAGFWRRPRIFAIVRGWLQKTEHEIKERDEKYLGGPESALQVC
jgi:hypothetical protein